MQIGNSTSVSIKPKNILHSKPALSSSLVILDWDSPSSTGGVSVSYILVISPTPLSRSPV